MSLPIELFLAFGLVVVVCEFCGAAMPSGYGTVCLDCAEALEVSLAGSGR